MHSASVATTAGDEATPIGTNAGLAVWTRGLTKVYPGGIRAVNGLGLEVRTGEILGLLGPNGAGKTTTVGMLTTRIVPTAGRAVVGSVDVVSEPARARRRFGVMSQANTLDRSLNVRENLVFHGRYFGMSGRAARRAADEWLDAFRLSKKAKARIAELSGGMVRRLMLARAMFHGPDVLFLDEPTAGLDPQSRVALWAIVEELRCRGRTIVVTTHYIDEADRFCDRVAIMDGGAILAVDTPSGLKRAHGKGVAITIRGDGDPQRFARRLSTLRGARASVGDDGVDIHLDSGDGALGAVNAAAEGSRFRITAMSLGELSLETVFFNLTGREIRE